MSGGVTGRKGKKMSREELREALRAVLAIDKEELQKIHPTVAYFGTEFIDYTDDGTFKVRYPIRDVDCNGYHVLQGGRVSALMDNNFGIFMFVATDGSPMTTIDMHVTYHRAMTKADGYVTIHSRVRSAGKRILCLEGFAYDSKGRLCATGVSNVLNINGAYISY